MMINNMEQVNQQFDNLNLNQDSSIDDWALRVNQAILAKENPVIINNSIQAGKKFIEQTHSMDKQNTY